MKNITAKNTIEKCREIFSRFGIPRILVTDNGRTFISQKFQDFIEANGIIHKRTALYHPATNSLIERFVQTLKQGLRKVKLMKNNKRKCSKISFSLSHHSNSKVKEIVNGNYVWTKVA